MIKKIEFKSKEIKALNKKSFITVEDAQNCLDSVMLPGKEKELEVKVEYYNTGSLTFTAYISRSKKSLTKAAAVYSLDLK